METQDLITPEQIDRIIEAAVTSHGPIRPIKHPCAVCGNEGPWYVAFAFGEQLLLSAGKEAGPARRVEHPNLDGAICASCLETTRSCTPGTPVLSSTT